MIQISEKEKCMGCHACANTCPRRCILMKADENGFLYPYVDMDSCVDCGSCEEVCPILNPYHKESKNSQKAYAAYCKDEQIRRQSSSGGIFTLLAQQILANKGAVFGAAFDENYQVHHIAVHSYEHLSALRGSKYVQSRIESAYCEAKGLLEAGMLVYFSGTPCQIDGLRKYLKNDYVGLITQDVICHGVPAPAVWKRYTDFRVNLAGADIKEISFRQKSFGWRKSSVSFFFKNGVRYQEESSKDSMMRVFLKDLCLRPSCYVCKSKGVRRNCDITLADFWGIEKVLPLMDNDKGVSLVICHTQKGRELFERIAEKVVFQEVNIYEAIRFNPAMVKSPEKPSNYEQFMKDIYKGKFDEVAERYCKTPMVQVLKSKLRYIKIVITGGD